MYFYGDVYKRQPADIFLVLHTLLNCLDCIILWNCYRIQTVSYTHLDVYKRQSEKKVLSMFDSGVTVLFVSHSLAQVQRICNKAMILEKGKLIAYGDIDTISEQYENCLLYTSRCV